MGKRRTIKGGDFFCGAGGFTTGLMLAAVKRGFTVEDFIAVNCNPTAIATHQANHHGVRHYCRRLEGVPPEQAVPGGRLDVLLASPECTHHSLARGGKPMNDQSRAGAFLVLQWASQLYIDRILLENVKEFRDWGPLGVNKRPVKARKGECYRAFIDGLKALGYTVEERLLNAADYGAHTSRVRLFIQAVRRGKIVWPKPTHEESGLLGLPRWRPAWDIIDHSLEGKSIFDRARPLSPKTLERIYEGLRKFGLTPYLVPGMSGYTKGRSVDRPLHTVTTNARGEMLCEPCLVKLRGTGRGASVRKPAPTITAGGTHLGIAEPFLITMEQGGSVRSIRRPVPTITTAKGGAFAIAEPILIESTHNGKRRSRSLREPLPTITAARRGELAIAEPFLVKVTAGNDDATSNARRSMSVKKPLPTVTAGGVEYAITEPFLVKYYGSEKSGASVRKPLDTVTSKARFGLVRPVVIYRGRKYLLDVKFRMLQPHELAAAMGFPKAYKFTGNKTDQVRQIGNAVECTLAQALGDSLLEGLAAA